MKQTNTRAMVEPHLYRPLLLCSHSRLLVYLVCIYQLSLCIILFEPAGIGIIGTNWGPRIVVGSCCHSFLAVVLYWTINGNGYLFAAVGSWDVGFPREGGEPNFLLGRSLTDYYF